MTGELFERDVADLLRLLPLSEVTPQVRLSGKAVDVMVVLDGKFGNANASPSNARRTDGRCRTTRSPRSSGITSRC
jgi:hypothetical protein